MRIVSFERKGAAALGVRIGEDEVVDLSADGLPQTLEAFLSLGVSAREAARRLIQNGRSRLPLAGLKLLAPLRSPAKAIAVGLNYVDHAAESKFERPFHPVLFQRYPSSWVGPLEPLIRPRVSNQFDYEGELVVVIGKAGRYVSRDRALEYVAGYSVFNDGSIRDYQFKSGQWMIGKNFERSGALGPQFVTADDLPAGALGLRLQTRLNGNTVQDANTRDMIFDVAQLVAACSEPFKLLPGDLIISGTPSGVGMARKPQLFMRAGDHCEVEIEGVGLLMNTVIDED